MVICPWEREKDFRRVLEKEKLRAQDVEILSKIAVEDARECYKHVCLLVEKAIRRSDAKDRFSFLHLLSSILRRSRNQLRGNDKYSRRLADRMPKIFKAMADIPSCDQVRLMGMLQCWKKERIFSSVILEHLESEAAFVAAQRMKRSRTSQAQTRGVHGMEMRENHKRASPDQDIESRLGSQRCSGESRKAPCSTHTSEHCSDVHSGVRELEAAKNCAWLPSHIKFVPGKDLPEELETPIWIPPVSQICEDKIPGACLIQEVDGTSHKPSWPPPKVAPPLVVPGGSRRIGCS